ncbi:unnamed protein product, partial [Brassica rapa subsp. trilocularis]
PQSELRRSRTRFQKLQRPSAWTRRTAAGYRLCRRRRSTFRYGSYLSSWSS